MNQSSNWSTPLPAFGRVSVSNFGYSNRYVVIFQFYFHFSDNICCGASFHRFICHCVFSFLRYLLRLAHFLIGLLVFFLLSFKFSVYF